MALQVLQINPWVVGLSELLGVSFLTLPLTSWSSFFGALFSLFIEVYLFVCVWSLRYFFALNIHYDLYFRKEIKTGIQMPNTSDEIMKPSS